MRRDLFALLLMTGGVAGSALLGCSGDTSGTAPGETTATYGGLALNEHAITMSLQPATRTIQLTAAPLTWSGTPLPGSHPVVTYRATDSSVTVDTTGLVTAHYVTPPSDVSSVIATCQIGNVTWADTAYIRVSDTTATVGLASFSIQPAVNDSAVGAVGGQWTPRVTMAQDSLGRPVSFVLTNSTAGTGNTALFWVAVSRPVSMNYPRGSNSRTSNPVVSLTDTGHVTVYATAWVYGVSVRDSLRYVVGWPLRQFLTQVVTNPNVTFRFFGHAPIFLGVGGVVKWQKVGTDSAGVIFDDSAAVDSGMYSPTDPYTGSGNVYFASGVNVQIQSRSFPIAGTYVYHSVLDPRQMQTIYVLNNPSR